MRHVLRVGVVSSLASLALVASATAGWAASPSPSGPSTLAVVGDAPVVPRGAYAIGVPPTNTQVSFSVVVQPHDPAGLAQFAQDVSTPGSPSYRHFLRAGEYETRFGPTAKTLTTVAARLRSLGLVVGTPTGSVLPVSGSEHAVGAALHTTFSQYRVASGRVARANTSAPQLPVEVAASVQSIVGLDDLVELRHTPTSAGRRLSTPNSGSFLTPFVAGPAPCPSITGGSAYTADQIAARYGLTSFYGAGNLGAGVTVAVAELEPFQAADISAYQACYGTSATVNTVTVGVGAAGPDGGEAALDIEDIIGLAPAAAVSVYEAPNSSSGVLNLYNRIATDNIAQVVSTSWGLCEALTGASFASTERLIFQQMAVQGQTMLAATGDTGSEACFQSNASTALGVSDPASQPEVTGVGGTSLTTVTGPEVTRNVSSDGAGGGGSSALWTRPAWQPVAGTARQVPDVSASADSA
ncbi:MAG: hypothetical protein QOJ62_1643, partial [Actinomycetota bacterium]|nr:hypothetical protein [Actinomycetota bacterium]